MPLRAHEKLKQAKAIRHPPSNSVFYQVSRALIRHVGEKKTEFPSLFIQD
jgi:hypothetical protein